MQAVGNLCFLPLLVVRYSLLYFNDTSIRCVCIVNCLCLRFVYAFTHRAYSLFVHFKIVYCAGDNIMILSDQNCGARTTVCCCSEEGNQNKIIVSIVNSLKMKLKRTRRRIRSPVAVIAVIKPIARQSNFALSTRAGIISAWQERHTLCTSKRTVRYVFAGIAFPYCFDLFLPVAVGGGGSSTASCHEYILFFNC